MSETPSEVRYDASAGFIRLLETTGCSLAITVYLSSSVLLISAADGKLLIQATRFDRPMGLAARREDKDLYLALATFQEVVVLGDTPLLAPSIPDHEECYDHLLVPRATLFSGDIDAHDLVWLGTDLYVANTRFSCVARIDGRYSFTPVWQPPFVTSLMPEDRCHLNGLAAVDGRIAYVTALGRTDAARGWREGRVRGGVLLEVPSGEAVLEGLSVPHSPRILDGQLYVLESGEGRVLKVAPERGTSEPLAELPGFTRGLDRYGDVLFVGLSRTRRRGDVRLPVEERCQELICGIVAIERRRGQVLGVLRFDDAYQEIFDVKVLPRFRRGGMLGVGSDGHRRALVMPGRAFWGDRIEQG